jgi:hypothetical protein
MMPDNVYQRQKLVLKEGWSASVYMPDDPLQGSNPLLCWALYPVSNNKVLHSQGKICATEREMRKSLNWGVGAFDEIVFTDLSILSSNSKNLELDQDAMEELAKDSDVVNNYLARLEVELEKATEKNGVNMLVVMFAGKTVHIAVFTLETENKNLVRIKQVRHQFA